MQQIMTMIRKEFAQIFRTREMIAIIFGMPLIQTLILGFAISTEVKHISLVIADNDKSKTSMEITRAFSTTDRFDLLGYETDMKIITESIMEWDAQMALVIPPNFGRDLQRGLKPQMQVIVDGLDGNTAGVALGYAQGILTGFAGDISTQFFRKGNPPKLIEMEPRMWYNLDLDPAQYMVPGIVVVLITLISLMLSAISLVREKEIGTLEQLMVTPLSKLQLLFGKLIPFLILTFFELAFVMTAAQFIFDIRMMGSYLLLGGLAFLYLFTTLGLGIFVSTITNSQQQAMFISWFFMLFLLLLSGLFIPIENMPPVMRNITYLNPMRYFMYIMRDIFQKGSSFTHLLPDIIPMTIYGLLIFTLSVMNFRKRVA